MWLKIWFSKLEVAESENCHFFEVAEEEYTITTDEKSCQGTPIPDGAGAAYKDDIQQRKWSYSSTCSSSTES